MSLDELTKKTTIDFPRPIRSQHAEDLLCYLSSHLPANVSGKIGYFINYIYDPETESSSEDKGTLKLSATVNSLKEAMAFDSFQSKPWEANTSYISAIEFQRVPDWELEEYRPEIRKLWDDVRECVGKYFEEVLKVKI